MDARGERPICFPGRLERTDFPEAFFHVVGRDGSAHVDLINNTYQLDQATKYIDAGDRFLRRLRQSWQIARGGLAGFLRYGLSTLGILKRSDPYYASMLGCARAYYAGFKQPEKSPSSAQKGFWVIQGLEDAANAYRKLAPPAAPRLAPSAPGPVPKTGDVLVLGGTGFIGRHVVKALKLSGRSVRLLARRPSLVPYAGTLEQPAVIVGDIRQTADVERAVTGCSAVIHLVSGAPATWTEYERLFVGGTRNVAEACLEAKVPQLLFVSSIAALDLGKLSRAYLRNKDQIVSKSQGRQSITQEAARPPRAICQLWRIAAKSGRRHRCTWLLDRADKYY